MNDALTWTDALALQQPQIDRTHQEFVELLNTLAAAVLPQAGAGALPAFDALLAHTEQHFAMEEGWMAATGFTPENCHSRQHQMVLELMREVRSCALDKGEWEPLARLVPALAEWFPQHAEMMDAALVFTMQQLGFDPAQPHAVAAPSGAVAGCGSCAT
ncbi:MAG: hemerythrin domain-containing protein [Inhella sp.]